MSDADHNAGGQGECVRLSRSDLLLLRRAARQDWGVPDVARNEAIYQALKILSDPKAKDRAKVAAMKTLVSFDLADIAHARLALAQQLASKDLPDDDGKPRIIIPGADDGPLA